MDTDLATILINESALSGRTSITSDTSCLAGLENACDAECDSAPVQVGASSMARVFWGYTATRAYWQVRVYV